jgi:inosine/xanthosine triphosphatase
MKTWRVAVGSTRRPKLNAVSEAAAAFGPLLGGDTTLAVRGYEVESGVNHTPLSRVELMKGARQRAEAVAELVASLDESAEFFVGLEGGLDVVPENGRQRVFLESWAYVSDGRRGHFGCSGSVELPEALVEKVLVRGRELAVAIDEFAGAAGIRDAQGAWGVLTGNQITRQESFRLAVVAAFAPFYNSKMYRPGAAAGA